MRVLIAALAGLVGLYGCASETSSPLLGRYTGQLSANGGTIESFVDVVPGGETELALDFGDGCIIDIREDDATTAAPGRYLFSQNAAVSCISEQGPVDIDLLLGSFYSDSLQFTSHWILPSQTYTVGFLGAK